MTHQILSIEQKAEEKQSAVRPKDESTRNLIADLADREKHVGQTFHLEPLNSSKHRAALCVGVTELNAVFCIPPQSGRSPAIYLLVPLVQIVVCNGFFKWASPYLSSANSDWLLVPPLEVGVQYFFKLSEYSEKIIAEDLFNVDTMARRYSARFAGIKLPKPLPTEMEPPTVKPLQPKPKRSKAEEDPLAPDLCP